MMLKLYMCLLDFVSIKPRSSCMAFQCWWLDFSASLTDYWRMHFLQAQVDVSAILDDEPVGLADIGVRTVGAQSFESIEGCIIPVTIISYHIIHWVLDLKYTDTFGQAVNHSMRKCFAYSHPAENAPTSFILGLIITLRYPSGASSQDIREVT